MSISPVNVFWFRRDLRLDDNCGLFRALETGKPVLPVFIFDTDILQNLADKRDARVDFIHRQIEKLNQVLVSKGSSLYVAYGKPLECFKEMCSAFSIYSVYTNHDYEPYAIERDKEIEKFLASRKIVFKTFKDQVIFEKNDVLKADGAPYTVFTPYSKVWKQKYLQQKPYSYDSQKLSGNFLKREAFPVPSLKELGFQRSGFSFPAAKTDKDLIRNYGETRNIPAIQGTSRLGLHLRFGTISVRNLVNLAHELNEQWLNEFIWREFFMMILFHFPRVVSQSFKPKYDRIEWRNNEAEFDLWCRGETGYPIVDAGMRELNATGFMHNRVRMITASFLTKHLLIDWRWGEAYFAEKLLDYELSSNNGNWQWAAGCGCDAAPYFRIFNPYEQTRKFDPEHIYIRKWLGNMENYPLHPIVDHDFARKRALATYKKYLD
jgi:deoxyribodipyrimidine photo-lyase